MVAEMSTSDIENWKMTSDFLIKMPVLDLLKTPFKTFEGLKEASTNAVYAPEANVPMINSPTARSQKSLWNMMANDISLLISMLYGCWSAVINVNAIRKARIFNTADSPRTVG